MTDSTATFMKDLRRTARDNDVELFFGQGKRVRCPGFGFTNGYFDTEPFRLATARGKPVHDWLPILVHESCHMDQWFEQSPYWTKETDAAAIKLELFLEGRIPKNIEDAFTAVLMLEADCERRSVEKIIKYDLPIDPIIYAQGANSYLFFHAWMYTYRKWYTTAPYEIIDVVSLMDAQIHDPEYYTLDNLLAYKHLSVFDLCGEPNV